MKNDICSFRISIPDTTDMNDVMYFRLEYLKDVSLTLLKAKEINEPISLYTNVNAG